MRLLRLSSLLQNTRISYCPNTTLCWPHINRRSCSCSALLGLSITKPLNASRPPQHRRGLTKPRTASDDDDYSPADHRAIGTEQSLFTTHPSSPGAPFFQPDGTHLFQKLVSFLRAQYPHFGFREVLTPTMYKKTLWQQSGHWENYKDNMFTVIGNPSGQFQGAASDFGGQSMQPEKGLEDAPKSEDYGLKPMNCPGHCLLYKTERRSYRDLPIRYAEFSPLHRNEISGALSGLTRVRRFHQDDGHIFCRPSQIKQEIAQSLAFIRMVYKTLGLRKYRFVLSTRPEKDYIGSAEEWDRAEEQLKAALNELGSIGVEDGKVGVEDGNIGVEDGKVGLGWKERKGDGAFYGPKIDVILRDDNGKEHQTGTIQLDFQLPKRFELEYESPAVEMEVKGENWKSSEKRAVRGIATPVMIHRAILGSLERFMALLLENCRGKLPFWLSPKQFIILTVGDEEPIKAYANKLRICISDREGLKNPKKLLPKAIGSLDCMVDIDDSGNTMAQKVVRAKKENYNVICVVGQRNLAKNPQELLGATMDLDVSAQPDQRKTWDLIETVKPGSQAPVQKDKGTGAKFRGLPGVRMNITQCKRLIRELNANYC